jgi:cytoskeletal protein CcmA (bactofilin family)
MEAPMLLTRKDSTAGNAEPVAEKPSLAAPGLFKPAAVATAGRPAALSDASTGDAAGGHGRKLIVGQGISLSGEITACDRLVVEGTVKVVLNKTRAIEIAETGKFTDGKAEVDEAEISGVYEGELTVRGRLLIRATGRVTGSIRYGELEVERGGQLGGQLALLDTKS